MTIVALDPGPQLSAILAWDGSEILWQEIVDSPDAAVRVVAKATAPGMSRLPVRLAIEKVESYGMAVGAEVFDTCLVAGRCYQAWIERSRASGIEPALIGRGKVKLHLCQSMRAKDSNIRQALIDRFGPPGTKKAPGVLYGVKSHLWAALALAVYAHDTFSGEGEAVA